MSRKDPETVAEIQAEIGRLTAKLAGLVLGDQTQGVSVPLIKYGSYFCCQHCGKAFDQPVSALLHADTCPERAWAIVSDSPQ